MPTALEPLGRWRVLHDQCEGGIQSSDLGVEGESVWEAELLKSQILVF